MTSEPVRYNIVSGPSREELFDSLRLSAEIRPIDIEWINADGQRQQSHIEVHRIGAFLNGTGGKLDNEWHVEGLAIDVSDPGLKNLGHVDLTLNTKNRLGTIVFTPVKDSEDDNGDSDHNPRFGVN